MGKVFVRKHTFLHAVGPKRFKNLVAHSQPSANEYALHLCRSHSPNVTAPKKQPDIVIRRNGRGDICNDEVYVQFEVESGSTGTDFTPSESLHLD